MSASRYPCRGALVMTSLLLPLLAAAAEDPLVWLDRMGRAVEQLNYEGTLVHFTGSDATQLRIVHRFHDGVITERITADGARREIIRNNDEVMCILHDQRTVLIEKLDEHNRRLGPLRSRLPGAHRLPLEHYHLAFSGTESVAGRDTRIIAIRPRDALRYGYRISLDQAVAMPLKTQLIDADGGVPEQLLFTAIALHEGISEAVLRPSVNIATFTVRRTTTEPVETLTGDDARWAAARLPGGFELDMYHVHTGSGSRQHHLVYSDGLATVSMFIEPAQAGAERSAGLSQMGAANAYTVVRQGQLVTAVGEVPAATVEMLANTARPSAGAAQ